MNGRRRFMTYDRRPRVGNTHRIAIGMRRGVRDAMLSMPRAMVMR